MNSIISSVKNVAWYNQATFFIYSDDNILYTSTAMKSDYLISPHFGQVMQAELT